MVANLFQHRPLLHLQQNHAGAAYGPQERDGSFLQEIASTI
jgi:hypothetical protein